MSDRDRIEYLMNLHQLTPSQFADRTGIQRASVSHILGNRNKPSLEIMLKIYRAFPGVSLEWLAAGDGELPSIDVETENADSEDDVAITETTRVVAPSLFPSFMDDELPNKKSVVAAQEINNKKEEAKEKITNVPTSADDVPEVAGRETAAPTSAEPDAQLSLKVGGDRRVKEIKVFYDNGTYETFLPEKSCLY
jgi:transcriptional regulator with XRE-family HTH domain